MSCIVCVPEGEVYVVEEWGRYKNILYPGFAWINPCCGESVRGRVTLRLQELLLQVETKTLDNVFVSVHISVQYEVIHNKVQDAFYKLSNQRRQITSYVEDVVRSAVPKLNLDDVFISKSHIAEEVKEQLSKSMESFGLSITQALLIDIAPAAKVKAAMNEINAATRLRQAAAQKAEADKIQVVKAAEADAEAKFLAGQGMARQRQAIINGLRESVTDFNEAVKDISSREVMEMMLMTQYFDTLRELGMHGDTKTVFVPHQPGAISDVSAQVRNGFLQASAATPAAQSMMR